MKDHKLVRFSVFSFAVLGWVFVVYLFIYNDNEPSSTSSQIANNRELSQNTSQQAPKVDRPMTESANAQVIAQMSQQLQSLSSQVNMLKMQLETANRGGANNASNAQQDLDMEKSQPVVATMYDEAQRAAAAETAMTKQMAVIEERFQAQEIDPSWSQAIETRLQEAFLADSLNGHTIQSVECRSSLCKLDIVPQQEGGDPGGFHIALRDQVSDLLPAGAMHPNGNGGVTLFLSKDGNDLNVAQSAH